MEDEDGDTPPPPFMEEIPLHDFATPRQTPRASSSSSTSFRGTEGDDPNAQATPATSSLEMRLECASREDTSAWFDAYRRLMSESIQQVHVMLASPGWKHLCAPSPEEERVHIYELTNELYPSFHTLRARAALNVRPERLMWVIRDHDEDTRLVWDWERTVSCSERERFDSPEGSIHVIESRFKMGGIPLVWDRYAMGIYWCGYDPKTRAYKYVFRTTQHRLFKCPSDCVGVIALVGVIVRHLEDPSQCEMAMVVHANAGDRLPSYIAGICKEWMRERIFMYERVAQQWSTYYGPSADPKRNRK